MRIVHSIVLLTLLFATPAYAAYEFVVHEGKVYEVTTQEILPEDVGTAIGEVMTMSTEIENGASNVFPVGTFYYEVQGIDRRETIAVEKEPGVFVLANYAEPEGSGFSLWTALLVVVGILVVIVGTMSFRNQRSHVKQYRE